MAKEIEEWVGKVQSGDRRAIARALSAIERGDDSSTPLLKSLFLAGRRAEVVGVTGAPGVGKSTLVEKLARICRGRGLRVGIIAVDPTSPFSGGAILGDRIRMQTLSGDEGVFIRSMATRGHLGGLAAASQDAVTVLEAAGCDLVVVETVGVGQDEVEVAGLADTTLLVLAPGMGDDVQTFKAGVMEIADVFVINKADHPGVERTEQEITQMLSVMPAGSDRRPPIVRTIATTGEGVEDVERRVEEFRAWRERSALGERRTRKKWRERLLQLVRQRVLKNVVEFGVDQARLEECVERVLRRQVDPHTSAEELLKDLPIGSSRH